MCHNILHLPASQNHILRMSLPVYTAVPRDEANEEQDDRKATSSRSRKERWMSFGHWALTVVLAVWATLATIALFAGSEIQIGGDVNGIAPSFPQKIVTFLPDYASIANLSDATFSNATRPYWLDLVPKGLGFLDVPHPELYPQLSPPYHKHNKTVYSTSVTHQLHCLYMIMGRYNDLIVNGYQPSPEGVQDRAWHHAHCFDYIRQSIMCCGDTALEGEETTFPEGIGGTDGWNVKHVCKDWNPIHAWLEDKAVDHRIWI